MAGTKKKRPPQSKQPRREIKSADQPTNANAGPESCVNWLLNYLSDGSFRSRTPFRQSCSTVAKKGAFIGSSRRNRTRSSFLVPADEWIRKRAPSFPISQMDVFWGNIRRFSGWNLAREWFRGFTRLEMVMKRWVVFSTYDEDSDPRGGHRLGT